MTSDEGGKSRNLLRDIVLVLLLSVLLTAVAAFVGVRGQ